MGSTPTSGRIHLDGQAARKTVSTVSKQISAPAEQAIQVFEKYFDQI